LLPFFHKNLKNYENHKKQIKKHVHFAFFSIKKIQTKTNADKLFVKSTLLIIFQSINGYFSQLHQKK